MLQSSLLGLQRNAMFILGSGKLLESSDGGLGDGGCCTSVIITSLRGTSISAESASER